MRILRKGNILPRYVLLRRVSEKGFAVSQQVRTLRQDFFIYKCSVPVRRNGGNVFVSVFKAVRRRSRNNLLCDIGNTSVFAPVPDRIHDKEIQGAKGYQNHPHCRRMHDRARLFDCRLADDVCVTAQNFAVRFWRAVFYYIKLLPQFSTSIKVSCVIMHFY